jgi:hypothetical protein
VKPGGTSSAGAALPGKPGGTSPSMPAAACCGLTGNGCPSGAAHRSCCCLCAASSAHAQPS